MKKLYKKSSGKWPKPTVNEGFKAFVGAGIALLFASVLMAVTTIH